LKNEEELKEDAKKELEELRSSITEIGMASVMKEKLRSVYRLALDFDDAEQCSPIGAAWRMRPTSPN
jgi:hypothetical protein